MNKEIAVCSVWMACYLSNKCVFKSKEGGKNRRNEENMLERGFAIDIANLMDIHKEGGGG